MHQNLCLPVPRVHRTLENCPDPNALQSSFLFISEHLSPGRIILVLPPTTKNKKSLIILFLLSFGLVLSLFFCYQLSGLKPTYLLSFSASLTEAENNQIKKSTTKSQLKTKKKGILPIYIYKIVFFGFLAWLKTYYCNSTTYLYYISCNSFAFKFQSKTYLVYITYIQNFLCLILHNPRLNIFASSFSTQETRRKQNKEKLSQVRNNLY